MQSCAVVAVCRGWEGAAGARARWHTGARQAQVSAHPADLLGMAEVCRVGQRRLRDRVYGCLPRLHLVQQLAPAAQPKEIPPILHEHTRSVHAALHVACGRDHALSCAVQIGTEQ